MRKALRILALGAFAITTPSLVNAGPIADYVNVTVNEGVVSGTYHLFLRNLTLENEGDETTLGLDAQPWWSDDTTLTPDITLAKAFADALVASPDFLDSSLGEVPPPDVYRDFFFAVNVAPDIDITYQDEAITADFVSLIQIYNLGASDWVVWTGNYPDPNDPNSAPPNNPFTNGPTFSGNFVFAQELSAAPLPEPSTLALLGIGSVGIGFARRRRRLA